MKALFILFALSWPLALLALVLFPLVWLLSRPLRLLGITVGAAFALLKALLFLPSRLLGNRGRFKYRGLIARTLRRFRQCPLPIDRHDGASGRVVLSLARCH